MHREISPWVIRGMYVLALIMAISPVVEWVSTIWPLRFADLIWRYGALGLGAAYLPNSTLGLALVMILAYWREHPGVLLGAGVVSVLVAVAILPAMGMFALDLADVRALREPGAQGNILAAGVLQELKYLASGAALACLGVGGIKMGVSLAAHVGSAPRAGILKAKGVG